MDEAFAEVEAAGGIVFEHKYRVPHVQHVPLETHATVAQMDGNGKITLWASSQSPFAQRNLIAKALDLGHSRLRVITPYVGGGFGAKAGVSMEGACVGMAMRSKGRPVKLVMTREEEFYTTFVRQGLVAIVKLGMLPDGRILAMKNTYYWDGGAHTEYGVNITRAARLLDRAVLCAQRVGRLEVRLHQPSDWRRDAWLRHARNPLGHRTAR
ncbi:molybdopterin cofactor-binding domain-containing protein [Candidatus Amarolinea dominans]|uniref:molybdopterin cofactor-binding domain-containing protein n=1 Tax=Candidatus Amarolinea dominans TaxID=3140696 RepID=UPI0031CCA775